MSISGAKWTFLFLCFQNDFFCSKPLFSSSVSGDSLGRFFRPRLKRHSRLHRYLQLLPDVFNGFLELSIIRISEQCRALVFRQPTDAFPLSELLLTYRTTFQATKKRVWWVLEVL